MCLARGNFLYSSTMMWWGEVNWLITWLVNSDQARLHMGHIAVWQNRVNVNNLRGKNMTRPALEESVMTLENWMLQIPLNYSTNQYLQEVSVSWNSVEESFFIFFLTHNITDPHKTNTLKECSMPPGGSTAKGNFFTQEYFSSMDVWPHEIGSAVHGKEFRGVEIAQIPLSKSCRSCYFLILMSLWQSIDIHFSC